MREFRSRYTMDIDSPIEIPQANLLMAIVRKQGRNFSSHAWILTTCVLAQRQCSRCHSRCGSEVAGSKKLLKRIEHCTKDWAGITRTSAVTW